MKVLLVVDAHLVRTPDGAVWSSTIYDYNFFARYCSVFDEVLVATRIIDRKDNDGFPRLCSGEKIEFFSLPDYRGPWKFALKFIKISRMIKSSFSGCDCAIFRIPSSLGYMYANSFRKTGKPYAIEVVVDPWDFAAPGTMKTILRPIIRLYWTINLKRICLLANGVSYVTEKTLQKRYPSRARKKPGDLNYFESFYSSVELPDSFFSSRKVFRKKNYIDIVHVSNSIGNYVKGHKEIIESTKILKDRGLDVRVTFVGDGPLVDDFKRLAEEKGVSSSIRFIGKISNPDSLGKEIQKHDLFVFPSHAEGLPRSLIEAMALGLPCIASNINGIPELLDEFFLIPVGDSRILADKIQLVCKDICFMEKAGEKNRERALDYSSDKLKRRRNDFYNNLRKIVER